MSVLPALIGAVSLLFVLFYPLNEMKMGRIASELKARRAADATREGTESAGPG